MQKEGDTIERNMHDDVAAIRDVVQTALDRGNDVVLVAVCISPFIKGHYAR